MSKNKRIRNDITPAMRSTINERLKMLVKTAGGPIAVCEKAGISIGTLKGYLGSKERVVSPKVLAKLLDVFTDVLPKKFTREYMRPDILPSQWERLE